MKTPLAKVVAVDKSFHVGDQDVEVLRKVSLQILPGDFLLIFGPSGCGKSTLLHILLGLEPPTRGEVALFDKKLYQYSADERSELRKQKVGMVYQQANWISALTVLENVAFPLLLVGKGREGSQKKALEELKGVGMEKWADYLPTELSAGQQQKVSLARALVNDPPLLVADEPTGNLDTRSGEDLMVLLADLNKQGKTILMVTHDLEYLKYASRVVHMRDGQVEGEYDGRMDRQLIDKLTSQGKKGQNGQEICR